MTSQLSVLLLLASASLTRWPCQAEGASGQQTSGQTTDITTSEFWRHIDLKSQEIPEEIKRKVVDVDIKQTSITVDPVVSNGMLLLSGRRCCCSKWNISGKWNVDAVAANGISLLHPAIVNKSTKSPLTELGTLFVDGILASCYAYFDHQLVHYVLTLARLYPVLFTSHQEKEGTLGYVRLLKFLEKILLSYSVQSSRSYFEEIEYWLSAI